MARKAYFHKKARIETTPTVKKIIKEVGVENIQLVTVSRPSAYGEYEPYRFVDTEQEFEESLKLL